MKKEMFRCLFTVCLFTTTALFSGCCTTHEVASDASFNGACERMLQAIEADEQGDFEAEFDPSFRGLKPFRHLHDAIADRLAAGYRLHYLGQLQIGDQTLALWKVKFTDGGYDNLVKIAFYKGRATSFRLEL